jgi:hypothetical protein
MLLTQSRKVIKDCIEPTIRSFRRTDHTETKWHWSNIIFYRHAIDPSQNVGIKSNLALNSVNPENYN